jgi:hypothetical protein
MPKTCSHDNCNNPVFSKELCIYHWRGKYATRIPVYKSASANNSTPKIKKRKAVKKISDKHAEELEIYYKLREDFLNKHTECEIRKPGCFGVSNQVHHDRGRGKYLLDVSTWKAICGGPCHDEITVKSKEAIEDGHSQRRNTPIQRTIFHKNNTNIET